MLWTQLVLRRQQHPHGPELEHRQSDAHTVVDDINKTIEAGMSSGVIKYLRWSSGLNFDINKLIQARLKITWPFFFRHKPAIALIYFFRLILLAQIPKNIPEIQRTNRTLRA